MRNSNNSVEMTKLKVDSAYQQKYQHFTSKGGNLEYIGQVCFFIISAIIMFRFLSLVKRGRPYYGLISALACIMYIICLYISANMQASGLSNSKLVVARFLEPTDYHELNGLSFRWSIELLAVYLGEIVGIKFWRAVMPVRSRMRAQDGRIVFENSTIISAVLLFAIGLFCTIALSSDLSTRADGGQGLYTILKTCLVISLCVIFFYDFFNRKIFVIVGILGIGILIISAVRSPVLSVAIAYFAGRIARGEVTIVMLARFVATGFVVAILAAAMSNYRGEIIMGRQGSITDAASEAIGNPFSSIYSGGIDTLDGYRLAQQVQPSEDPDPLNILVAITTFVPRSMWPNKPEDLSLGITYRYLRWDQGGIFLSLIGYLSIAFGGYSFALFATFAIAATLSAIYQQVYRGFGGFVVILMTFRLFLAGSPFDIYYGLLMLFVWSAALKLCKILLRTKQVSLPASNKRSHQT